MWKDVSCAVLVSGPVLTTGVIYQSVQLVGATVSRQVSTALHLYASFFPHTYSISTIILVGQNSGTHQG